MSCSELEVAEQPASVDEEVRVRNGPGDRGRRLGLDTRALDLSDVGSDKRLVVEHPRPIPVVLRLLGQLQRSRRMVKRPLPAAGEPFERDEKQEHRSSRCLVPLCGCLRLERLEDRSGLTDVVVPEQADAEVGRGALPE